ncbi:hypothetical protein D3C86_1210880 [compost metagenome]
MATRLASIAAWSARMVASKPSSLAWAVSTALLETKLRASSSWLRESVRRASARSAWSRISWARAFARLASSMRVSSVNSRSPGFTVWPSLICTACTVLDTCGRTSTVCMAVTVPLAVTSSGTSPCWTMAVATVVATGPLGVGLGANHVL